MAHKGLQERIEGRAVAPDALSKAVRAARERAELTRGALAALLAVSAQTVYCWETGRQRIALDRVEDVARALDVPAVELLAAMAKKD